MDFDYELEPAPAPGPEYAITPSDADLLRRAGWVQGMPPPDPGDSVGPRCPRVAWGRRCIGRIDHHSRSVPCIFVYVPSAGDRWWKADFSGRRMTDAQPSTRPGGPQ